MEDRLEELRAQLRSGDKRVRAAAVEGLATLNTPAGWQAVIGALADERGEVADTAQWTLARASDEETLERLDGSEGLRSRQPLVRARVAELLGRLPGGVPRSLLRRGLHDDVPEVRRMALWSVERLARAGGLGEDLASLATEVGRRARSERDPATRARALLALAAPDRPAACEALQAVRQGRDPGLRRVAARLAPELLQAEQALLWLEPAAGDESLAVRRQALASLAELRTAGAAAVLVRRLGVEDDERLLGRAVEVLQGLSGLKFRRDPRPWQDWLRSLPAGWRGPRLAPGNAREPAGGGATTSAASLAGLPILSRRVTFLIDLSGSIWNERPDGRTRKAVIDGELRLALEALTPDTRFNLIAYTGQPLPWKDGLVPASRASVRAAASWFEARNEQGSGNFWDAALLALSDPQVDSLVFLFDGAPTGGTRHRLELIVPLFLELDAARGVVVDLLLVDASSRLQRLWAPLAEGTGGCLLPVSLKDS